MRVGERSPCDEHAALSLIGICESETAAEVAAEEVGAVGETVLILMGYTMPRLAAAEAACMEVD